jgi:hypothetical protein
MLTHLAINVHHQLVAHRHTTYMLTIYMVSETKKSRFTDLITYASIADTHMCNNGIRHLFQLIQVFEMQDNIDYNYNEHSRQLLPCNYKQTSIHGKKLCAYKYKSNPTLFLIKTTYSLRV